MDIEFYIAYGDRLIQLPVNPDKISVSFKGNNSTTEIIKLGEINILKDRKLREISFKSFFPYSESFPGIRILSQFRDPKYYKEFLQKIMDDKKPCRLIVTGIDLTLKCSVEQFEYYHQAGDHEDAYYSLSLKEYRDYSITPINNGASSASIKLSNASTSVKSVSPSSITVGCDVILNGRVHYDSYGAKPGKTFKNYRGKVNLINKKGSHPYHITTPSGGWLGWVTAESVVLA